MDKLPVGQLPDLASSNNDDEIMVITNSEYSQLKKEKISDLITDFTSTNENNALIKGTDGKMFVTDFGNASNITEGTLPTSVLPASGVTADTYAYPSSVTVNAQGQVTAIAEGTPSGANANTDLSNLTETGESHFANPNLSNLTDEGEKHFLNKTQITNCILSAPNGVATFSGSNITLKQGLKMLYSNGRNADGTLKNGELTLDSDTILDLSSYSGQTFDFELMFGCNINDSYLSQNYQESDVVPTNIGGINQIYLNTTENQMYFYNSSASLWEEKTFINLGKGKLENGVVTSFTPYQPVELIKRTDPQIQAPYITETYSNGASWYRVYSDGWCEQGGINECIIDVQTTISLLKNYQDSNYTVLSTYNAPNSVATLAELSVNNKQTGSFDLYTEGGPYAWRTFGYISQGE